MRERIESLDEQFAELHRDWCRLINQLLPQLLYEKPVDSVTNSSCGGQVLSSAAIVEQAFGGITVNLWDDPFEWTLPETLTTREKVLEYLEEVEATRRQAFETFHSDQDFSKEIVTPSGNTQLLPFLLDTLQRARHHHQRAVTISNCLQQQLTTDH
jgi:hypothetical protein